MKNGRQRTGKCSRLCMLIGLVLLVHQRSLVEMRPSDLDGAVIHIIPVKEQSGLVQVERDRSGNVVETTGILAEVLHWLAQYYRFRYVYLPDVVTSTDDSHWGRGLISFLVAKQADLALTASTNAGSRSLQADCTSMVTMVSGALLIPSPKVDTLNALAVVEPFEQNVWILTLVAILATALAICAVTWCLASTAEFQRVREPFMPWRAVHYVFEVLLSQGGNYPSKAVAARLVAGAWCLACFVLVTAYSSVLISCMLAPTVVPLIESLQDIPKNPHLRLVIDKGSSLDYVYRAYANVSAIHGYLYGLMVSEPHLRCVTTAKCLEMVRSGGHIYANYDAQLNALINEERRKSGTCDFTLAKKPMNSANLCMLMQKNSPYIEHFNKGIGMLWENGLMTKWHAVYYPKPSECLSVTPKTAKQSRLSTNNLLGAFVILLVGYILALFALLIELTVNRIKKR